jgi:hypothetical protein
VVPRRVRVAAGVAASLALAGTAPACWLTSSFDALVDGGAPVVAEAGTEAASDARFDGVTADAPSDVGPLDAAAPTDAGCLANDYVSSVLADQPLAYWRLDEDGGTTAHDSTHNFDGIYRNGVTLGVAGILPGDTAALFDGDGGYVYVGAHLAFLGTTPFSVEAWIRPTRIDGAFRGVLSNESPSISQRFGYLLYVEQAPDAAVLSGFERWNGGMSNPTVVVNDVTVGAWTHLVGTFDGTNETFYVNGSAVSFNDGKPITITTTGDFVLAALNSAATPSFFAGTVDEVAVYDHALSPTCILAHYDLALGKGP